jgi:hypothetical protein
MLSRGLVVAIALVLGGCKARQEAGSAPPPPPRPETLVAAPAEPLPVEVTPPPPAPTLPAEIGTDEGDPAKLLAHDAEVAMAAFDDPPPMPVTLTISMRAGKQAPAIDVEEVLRPRFHEVGLDAEGADPVAHVDVKCRERAGPAFEGSMFGQQTRQTWTRVSCALSVKPAKGKARSFTIEAPVPTSIYGDIDDASREQFLGSSGLQVLPEVAAVALGRTRRVPVLASLTVGLAREQSLGVVRELLAPHLAKLPASLRACVAVAQRKFKDAAALGDDAVPALWQLLMSDWGTAETVQVLSMEQDVHAVVSRRVPAVKALASIGGPRAGVLAGLVARALPVEGPDDEYDLILESPPMGASITAAVMHPGVEEGRLLVILLKTVLDANPPGAGDVLAKFGEDHRRAVRKAATGG